MIVLGLRVSLGGVEGFPFLLVGSVIFAGISLGSVFLDPSAEIVDKRHYSVGLVFLRGTGDIVAGQQLGDREPGDLGDFLAGLCFEDRLLGDASDDEEAYALAVQGGLHVLVGVDGVGDVVADLFEDFAGSAFAILLLFVDFPFRKTPSVGLAPTFHHEALGKVRGEQDSTTDGDLA